MRLQVACSGSDPRRLAVVFAGGAAGGLIRTALADNFPAAVAAWPWVTFSVNLLGCLLLGYFVAVLHQREFSRADNRQALLGSGLCGGLTTFSTLQLELLRMLEGHNFALALGYAGASTIGGYLAVVLGGALGRQTRRGM